MLTLFRTIAGVSSAVWLGWLVAMFVLVRALFAAELVRGDSQPERLVIFDVTEKAQLVLAALVLVGLAGWQVLTKRKAIAAWFGVAVVAALLAAALPTSVTGEMETLRVAGQTDTPKFRQLHGISIALYGGLTLLTGAILTGVIIHRDKPV
ncbi:MAG: hypothetical protein AAGD32_11355 [Planctomycetota bacterium]